MLWYSLIIIGLVLASQLFFNLFFSHSFFIKITENQLEKIFEEIEVGYEDGDEKVDSLLQNAESTLSIDTVICDFNECYYRTGEFRYISAKNLTTYLRTMMSETTDLPQVQEVDHRPGEYGADGKLPYVELMGKFNCRTGWRYVYMITPVSAIDNMLMNYTRISLVMSIFVILIGIIISRALANQITKPLIRMERSAKEMAELTYLGKLEEEGETLEIASLAKSLNQMYTKLANAIYKLQKANERLQKDVDFQKRNEQMRREFVANVSHEMKTPLCLLQMYSESLMMNSESLDKDYYCKTIIDETERLNDMVKRLLDISAIENDLVSVNLMNISLSKVSRRIYKRYMGLLQEYDCEVSIAKHLSVKGNEEYLEQVMNNFIGNAHTHTKVGGKIRIELVGKEGQAIFSVYNEGESIAEEMKEKIWESFYKTDQARVRTDENHIGLGLYIARIIIDKHKGTYGVENVEHGVKFWFAIPADISIYAQDNWDDELMEKALNSEAAKNIVDLDYSREDLNK